MKEYTTLMIERAPADIDEGQDTRERSDAWLAAWIERRFSALGAEGWRYVETVPVPISRSLALFERDVPDA